MPLFTILNSFIDSSFYDLYVDYFWKIPKYIFENADKILLLYTGKEILSMIRSII